LSGFIILSFIFFIGVLLYAARGEIFIKEEDKSKVDEES
jgi:uncharacterized membrane protein